MLMQMTKIALYIALAISVFPAQGFTQTAAQTPDQAQYQTKMERMASALGVSVYEDFPVAGGNKSAGGGVVYTSTQPRPQVGIPAPTPVSGASSVPLEFQDEEKAPFSATVRVLWSAVVTQLQDLGWFGTEAPPSFEAISARVLKLSKSKAFPARRYGQSSLFTEPGFVAEFEQVTGARFAGGHSVKFLIDGPASFAVKDALIKNAKKNLLISTWAFYDDVTGYETAQALIAKKKAGVKVRVLVDGIMCVSHGPKVLKMMEDAGVEVIRHRETKRTGDIWHVKVMVADDKYAVAGGMNFGDYYSHRGASPKWRDTDVFYSGPAVLESRRLLAEAWNKQIDQQKLRFAKIDIARPQNDGFDGGSARVAVVLQNPPEHSPILVSIVKAMYGATKTINIENAYFVALPVVAQAVLDARARGVEVNLVTNSKESIDAEGKPIVDAMNTCLIPLLKAGVNIYLKQGALQTLHSKFITVDGEFADIGSYNLHPRGERIDTEVNVNILDRAAVAELDAAFARDVAKARQVVSVNELSEKPGFLSQLMTQFFYAQLSPN
jgi:cardiolipin synthase A/B